LSPLAQGDAPGCSCVKEFIKTILLSLRILPQLAVSHLSSMSVMSPEIMVHLQSTNCFRISLKRFQSAIRPACFLLVTSEMVSVTAEARVRVPSSPPFVPTNFLVDPQLSCNRNCAARSVVRGKASALDALDSRKANILAICTSSDYAIAVTSPPDHREREQVFWELSVSQRHVQPLKLQAAAGMLRGTDKGVLEISLACGFLSASQFSATFLSHLTQSPSEYTESRRTGPISLQKSRAQSAGRLTLPKNRIAS
jgi:AraC-like DNA-binding protein